MTRQIQFERTVQRLANLLARKPPVISMVPNNNQVLAQAQPENQSDGSVD